MWLDYQQKKIQVVDTKDQIDLHNLYISNEVKKQNAQNTLLDCIGALYVDFWPFETTVPQKDC